MPQFPPVSSNMLDEGGAGKEGYVGGYLSVRCKGPSQLLREHRPEWEDGILRWGTGEKLILKGVVN